MKKLIGLVVVLCCAFPFQGGMAQSYPNHPIRWLIGFPAGGGTDIVARTIAAALSTSLGQQIIVENRPGAAGSIAAEAAARSAPDGYTIFTGDNGILVYNQMIYKKLAYDPLKDFAPVSMIGYFPLLLVVTNDFPARTLGEYVQLAKKEPGKIGYGSPGAGSPHHLGMELFKQTAGIDVVHIPYKGGAPAIQDLMAGAVPSVFMDQVTVQSALRAGKVRALATATLHRLPAFPDLPTFSESGYKDFEVAAFQGIVVPAGTPAAVVARLNREVVAALGNPDVSKRLRDVGIIPDSSTPEQFTEFLGHERTRWAELIRARNIHLEL